MDGVEERYAQAAALYGPALGRLARAYEADPDLRRDLVQELHLALWRSLAAFDGRCSLRSWVYRVAHNAAASHVARHRRAGKLTSLEDFEFPDPAAGPEEEAGAQQALARLHAMIRALAPPDAQVMLLYLEDLDAAAIGEVTGLSAGAVATRISRVKALLAKRFHDRGGIA